MAEAPLEKDSDPLCLKTDEQGEFQTPEKDIFREMYGHHGYISQLFKQIRELIQDPLNRYQVESLQEKICNQYEKFCEIYDQCKSNADSDQTVSINKSFDNVKAQYSDMMSAVIFYHSKFEDKGMNQNFKASESGKSGKSRSSSSTNSKTKIAEAAIRQKLAALKLEQFKKAQQAEREKEEAEKKLKDLRRLSELKAIQDEAEAAKLEQELWEEVDSDENESFSKHSNKNYIPVLGTVHPVSTVNKPYQDHTLQFSADMLNLPKPELMHFDGNPKLFRSFLTNFSTNISKRVKDPALKLTYLIQYCTGDAKRLISNCVLYPEEEGFDRAIDILKERYGKNHIIVQSYMEDLTRGPQLKPNDVDALLKLADDLRICQILLSQLPDKNGIDSNENLRAIIKRLPSYIQSKWVEEAAKISRQRRFPNFSDLFAFVQDRANVSNSMFGRDYALSQVSKSKRDLENKQHMPQRVIPHTTLSTQTNTNTRYCFYCKNGNHSLDVCFQFKDLSFQDRLAFISAKGLCFSCFKQGHQSRNCSTFCSKCKRRHNVLLHDENRTASATEPLTANNNSSVNLTEHSASENSLEVNSTSTKTKVSLSTLPVIVKGNGTSVRTYALIDSGSNTTLCSRKLYKDLNIEGKPVSYNVQTVNKNSFVNDQFKVSLLLTSHCSKEQVNVEALTVHDMPISPSNISTSDIEKWDHFQGTNITEVHSGEIGVLIGTDCPEMFWTLEEKRGGRKDPVAKKTLLGWTVMGPVSQQCNAQNIIINHIKTDLLQQQLEMQWNIDFNDANDPIEQMSFDDKAALKIMQESCKLIMGKYQVALPWKHDPKQLPNNRNLAEIRLKHLKRKLTNDKHLHEQYTTTVESYIRDGHAKLLTEEEAEVNTPQWYLPHHPVFKKSNPSKCRVVFDCAAKYNGASLNEALYQGPNFLNNLSGVLMRFRKDPIAVVADIEAMFHQCFVTEQDQQFLRFLWWEDGDLSANARVYVMKVHLFGAKSSPSVACFCMLKTAEDNENQFSKKTTDALRNSFYMDDLLESTSSVESATKLITELRDLLQRGGFNLTKCISTHRDVLKEIPIEHRAKSLLNIDIFESTLPQEVTLGLQWNVEDDYFSYDVQISDKPLTKRGMSSMSASLYDPLGFVSPVSLIPKMMLQTLCRLKLDWDEQIPTDIAQKMLSWKSNLRVLAELKIPRCVKSKILQHASSYKAQLHIFSDASEKAYGAAAYIKLYNDENTCAVNFIMGKSRVAPLKAITIPRLELTAATVAARMYKFIQDELNLKIDKAYFWTDSTIVLRYLQNKSTRFLRFVAHRIQVIQDLTSVDDWHYVPSKLNPADLASRGIESDVVEKLSVWLNGPKFLYQSHDYQEVLNLSQPITEEILEEKKVFISEVVQTTENYILTFSSFYKLCKCVAWWLKFIKYLQFKVKRSKLRSGQFQEVELFKHLQPKNIEEAHNSVIRFIQRQEFKLEIKAIENSQPVPISSVVITLNPVLQGGMLTVGGRLQFSPTDINKHPIILPSNNHVTDLIVRQTHERNGHVGVNHCLSLLGSKYYILKGYSNVKRVVSKCFHCKRQHKTPCKQLMAPLPEERTSVENPPFTHVGVDYFGPMSVKFGRGTTKRYGCLFTCLAIRAVHIEITHSLESDSFLMAFQRFQARRGKPTSMWSDCGSNFVAADKELQRVFKQLNGNRTQNALLLEAIEWNFIPPHAPHMGGVWERLIKSVKIVLRNLVGQRLLSDEELLSFMCEVEKILNDRQTID